MKDEGLSDAKVAEPSRLCGRDDGGTVPAFLGFAATRSVAAVGRLCEAADV